VKRFILSTDWWTDCDDAVAIRLLARAERRGLCSLAGVVVNACMEYTAPSVLGFLKYEGFGGVPAALDRDATDFGRNPPYQKNLAARLGGDFSEADMEEPVPMLRRLLAAGVDGGTEIIEIGYPQCLAALLRSGPDEISPLNGRELVEKKVAHLWMMAGNYADEARGRENNFCRNARSARGGEAVCRDWPTPVTFLGWEVGAAVLSGGGTPADDPLTQILADHGSPSGRASWDPLTVYMALCGSPAAAGFDSVRGTVRVDGSTGENFFTRDAAGRHAYVKKIHPDSWYEARLAEALAP